MLLAQIMARKAEINKRNAEIANMVSGDNVKKLSSEQLDAIYQEQDQLLEEYRSLQAEEIRLRGGAQNIPNPIQTQTEERSEDLSGLSYRQKVGLVLARKWRRQELTDVEKRAIGAALTTTNAVYVEASAMADGVNNAGVFISTKILLDLLREDGKLSPILGDVAFTHLKGYTQFPYRKGRDKARVKAEGAAGADNQMEWDVLNGKQGYLQTILVVTDEVFALADIDFGEYIINQILQDLSEDWSEEIIYADGTGQHINGLVTGAISSTYTGDEATIADIVKGIKKLKGKYRRGASLYCSQEIYDAIYYAVDNLGNFKHPLLNNTEGIVTLGDLRVKLDENLAAGDAIIGNVGKYYKANVLIPTRIENDRKGRYGKTEYIASNFTATAVVPDAFVYIHKA